MATTKEKCFGYIQPRFAVVIMVFVTMMIPVIIALGIFAARGDAAPANKVASESLNRQVFNSAFAELGAMPQFISVHTGFDAGLGRSQLTNILTGMTVANFTNEVGLRVKWQNGSWGLDENSVVIKSDEDLAKFMACMRAQARGITKEE
jgi:hypothetical protein